MADEIPEVTNSTDTAPAPETESEQVMVDAKELARLRHVDEIRGRVLTLQEKVMGLHADWKRKADAALAAKKTYDDHNAQLLDMISEFSDKQGRLPFMEIQPLEVTAAPDAPQPITDGWEITPVTCLGLPKGLTKKLADEHGIKTMGDLERRRRDKGRALDLAGIGPEKAERINNAADNWLAENRDKAVFDGAAATAEAAANASHFKLLVEVDAGDGRILPAGSFWLLSERLADGRLALIVSDDLIVPVSPNAAVGVTVAERATQVELLRPIPGSDNETDKLYAGATVSVIGWNGENPIVQAASGREVMAVQGDWKATETAIQEVQPE